MSGQAERYSFIRDKSGLSNKGFAESLGISTSMSSQISTGRVNFPRDLLPRLTAEHGVNLHWFLTGDGRSGLAGESDFVEIELLEQEAAAGQGREIEDYIEKRFLPVLADFLRPHNPANLKAVYVSGDSMTGENINDGDIAIFNTKQTEGNGIYVVSVGNSLPVKRVDFNLGLGEITLISANPAAIPARTWRTYASSGGWWPVTIVCE